MIVSTRGRYALRVMIDIAEHQETEGYIALKSVAERQNISQKYIESIMTMLSKAGFLDAIHGKGGGYRLNRAPENYPVREILELTEGSLAPVSCLECGAKVCEKKDQCRTIGMWIDFYKTTLDFFEKYTLKDLMRK